MYSHDQLCIYPYACRNIFNTIKTSGHSSSVKYTSHFIERVVCERELETEQRLQHIDHHPQLFWLSQPFSWAAQPRAWRPSLCWNIGSHSSIFSPTDLSPRLYNNLSSTYFLRASQFHTQFNPSTVKVVPDLLISSTGCTCYLHRCISSFDNLAGVNMQQQYFPNKQIFNIC